VEDASQDQHQDDRKVQVEGREDSEGPAQIKALEADGAGRVPFFQQQAGDQEAADDEKDRNTEMRKEQIGPQECAITTRIIEMARMPSRDGIFLAVPVIAVPLVKLRISLQRGSGSISNSKNLYFCEIYHHAHSTLPIW
jgi:hypothetical protein